MPSSSPTEYDYIIVGGGTAGCVVASRLRENLPNLSVALIEAGGDESANPMVQNPKAAPALHKTDLEWKYSSVAQAHLNGRVLPNWGGKILSGSSAVNYGAWTRGHAADYDRWAEQVGDSRWSFASLLPSFKHSEHWHDDHSRAPNPQSHGFDGPIRTQSGNFGFPLREPMKEAFQSVGFDYNSDMNSGDPNGVSPLVLNWHDLKRQHASVCYSLDGVHVMCNTVVSKVLFDESKRAVGVQLEGDKAQLRAKKEVIISCGSIRTPQLLLLSGIGPRSELRKYHIPLQADLYDVGKNYSDHHGVTLFWKLKNPEQGFALGAPTFDRPEFTNSLPMDWLVTGCAPDPDLAKAALSDCTNFKVGPRSDYELTPMYLTNGGVPNPWLPADGSYVSCGAVCLSATSRGFITLHSTDIRDNPVLDPNAVSTEHDRAVLRAGLRAVIDAMTSPPLAPFLESREVPPPGLTPLSKSSPDEDLDERIRALANPYFHGAGTASMGRVVDSECRVKGVHGLRVVDASIAPVTISAHLQAPVYALAEQAASMIVESAR